MRNKLLISTFMIVLILAVQSFAQITYKVLDGVVDTGAVVNLSTLAAMPITDLEFHENGILNVKNIDEPMLSESSEQSIFQSVYVEDPFVTEKANGIGDNTVLLNKLNVALQNNVAPPDPTIAVGPNHIIALTNNNNGFFIFDKEGNLLKSINTGPWWSAVWPEENGDPQIIYDPYEGRFVMVFMQINDASLTSANLIAYSDDDDPFGTWFMYRLPAEFHEWPDYPQLGFDDKAIYIMSQCFTFDGNAAKYTLIRILNKAELYASNAGPLSYKDIYDITLPGSSSRPMIIHPSFQYTASNEHYFLYANRGNGNFYALYKLSDSLGTPVLTGQNIPTSFGATPDAGQLGGTTKIASNGSHIKTAPVFRDGFLYYTHSVRNSQFPNYSSIKYGKIDVTNNAIVESAELGADGYFYTFPSITVDSEHNIGIVCSRSADTEYAGSYYVTRKATDPPGLSGAFTLQPGLGNYVCSFCGTRNRWGDYLGIYLDPANDFNMWMISEYAANTNTYAVSIGEIRMKPFPGIFVFPKSQEYAFGNVEIGSESDTIKVLVANYGESDLIINSIPVSDGDFHRVSEHNFPLTLSTYDSVFFNFVFVPSDRGQQSITYSINNNSTTFSGVQFTATGFKIVAADGKQLYAVSGSQNGGNTAIVDKLTGSGTNLGFSNFNDLRSLTIDFSDNIIYGVRSSVAGSEILRVNATQGDAYLLYSLPLPELYSIAFDNQGDFYGILLNGQIYKIDLLNGSYSLISTAAAQRITIAFNPISNDMWGSVRNFLGNPKDQIIKIDLNTGDTTRVGRTGFSINTNALIFDENGTLYGTKGASSVLNDLITIDTTTGIGTVVGSLGLKDITGLSYSTNDLTSVENEDVVSVPKDFILDQNFPNPFNPSTQIRFALPVNSTVKISVFNLLGEVVKEILNNDLSAGSHTVVWNGDDKSGNKVSTGIYFYELRATGVDGNQFNQIRKMVLLK